MPFQSRRRPILLFALTALVAGLLLLPAAATSRAAAVGSGSTASGDIYYPPNYPPVASDFSVSVTVGSSKTGMLGDYVVDPENETLTFFVNSAAKGNVTVDEITGQFSYTPNPTAFGTDSFTYYAYDPQQNKSNDATMTVNINRPPTAANQSTSVTVGQIFNGQLQGSDPDGDALTYAIVVQPTKGFVSLGSNGAFSYVPNTGASGSDSFTYKVTDGQNWSNIATITVSIQQTPPPNRAPSANNLTITATAGVVFNGQLQGSDPDGDTLTYVIVSQPSKGSLTLGASGTFIYTPNAAATGSDSFTYKVNDGNLDSNIATAGVTIQPTGGGNRIYLPLVRSSS
jgi:Big-like domain-containing protein